MLSHEIEFSPVVNQNSKIEFEIGVFWTSDALIQYPSFI